MSLKKKYVTPCTVKTQIESHSIMLTLSEPESGNGLGPQSRRYRNPLWDDEEDENY